MKKILSLIFLACLALVLAGCGPQVTHEQQRAVTDACHAAGMGYAVRGSQIICWAQEPAKEARP